MKKIFLFTALTLSVSACTGAEVRGNLGLDRRSPDAFNVVARPPLTVPKEFLLTPPDVGGDISILVVDGFVNASDGSATVRLTHTSKLANGFVVPMPTLPPFGLINIG